MTLGGDLRQAHANPPAFGAFEYFLVETNPTNGLVADKSQPGAPASIAAVDFSLAAYPVGVEVAACGIHERVVMTDAERGTDRLLVDGWHDPSHPIELQQFAPDMTGKASR